LRVQKSMNDAENRRFFRARRRKVVGSFRKRVAGRVVLELEISGKFSDFTQNSFANSDTSKKQFGLGASWHLHSLGGCVYVSAFSLDMHAYEN